MDKLLILMISGVVLTGGLMYDRHKIAQDGVSPIGQMLDTVGLGRYVDWEKITHANTSQHIRDQAGENLERMAQRHQDIQDKRREFVQRREEILGQLTALNQEIQARANHYDAILKKQRQEINEQFPEIERSLDGLIASHASGNGVVAPEDYRRFKEDLLRILGEAVPNPELAWPDLAGMLDELEPMLTVHGQAALAAGDCEDPSGCLDQKISDIKDLIKSFGAEAQKDITEVIRSADILAREYGTFGANIASSEKRFDGHNERAAGEFRALAQKLAQVSEKDLRDLMVLYRAFQEEQIVLLNNLHLNGQRLWESQQEFERRVAQAMDRLQKIPGVDTSSWIQEIAERHKKQEAFLAELTADEDHLRRLLKERWEENQRYMKELAAAVGLKVDAIMAARQEAERAVPAALSDRTAVKYPNRPDRDQPSRREGFQNFPQKAIAQQPPVRPGSPERRAAPANPPSRISSPASSAAEKARTLRNTANSGYENLRQKVKDSGRW